LFRRTHETAGNDVATLEARVERLEHAARTSPAAPGGGAPIDPSTGRAVLGGRARRPATEQRAVTGASTSPAASPTSEAPIAAPSTTEPSTPAARSATTSDAADVADVADAWEAVVKPGLKPLVRAMWSAGSFTRHDGDTWHFAVPNAAHGDKCEQYRAAVEGALSTAVGSPVHIVIGVGAGAGSPADDVLADTTARPGVPTPGAGSGSAADAAAVGEDDPDDIDPDELTDAPPDSVLSPIDRLAQAFPGSELVDDAS
jgi:DNA polymerase III subunit gamma/tau